MRMFAVMLLLFFSVFTLFTVSTLNNKDFMPKSAECPPLQEGPASGLVASPLPGILINNVDFIHVPVVLNFSGWNLAELRQCEGLNVSLMYTSLLKDIIMDYQGRSQDLTSLQKTAVQLGVLQLSSSLQGLDELAASMSSEMEMGMSVWNSVDLKSIRKHINYFQNQTGGDLSNLIVNGIRGLASEDHYTIYSMKDLLKMMDDIDIISTSWPAQSILMNESICNAYGSFVLNTVRTVLKDLENGRVPDILSDEDLAKLYCPACSSESENANTFWGCVISCKKLKFSTIRKLASVTPHPNKATCYLNSLCGEVALYVTFTLSLPVFNIGTSVFDKLATIQSVGILEDSILKERATIPSLIIFHNELQTWLIPNTDCCFVTGYKYICRCDVFNVRVPVCGYDSLTQNMSNSFTMSCPVRLVKWRVPIVKVTSKVNGQYCVVTNQKQYTYGGLPCNISTPNFCFQPHEDTIIGHTVISKIFDETSPVTSKNQGQNDDIPVFAIPIGPLTSKLKKLLEYKYSHLIQISNQKDSQIVNDMINSADSNLINNSLDQVAVSIQILIAIQVFVIIIIFCMLLCFCNMLKHQGIKLNELFSHPYLRIGK